jgi:hypothetical protein
MNRWLSVVVGVAVIAGVSGCNNPVCGPGTVQVQGKNNKLTCQPVDVQAAGIPCDADGGAAIVGGKCVSTITCGDGTALQNGVCVGTGTGGDVAPPCPKPVGNTICVHGLLRNFLDSTVYKTTDVHLALYAPLDYINHMPALASQDIAAGTGGYIFQGIAPPSLTLIAVVAGDMDLSGANTGTTLVSAASGAQNVAAGGSYLVDVYVLPRGIVDGWGKTSGGQDWYTTGGYISKFYSDAKPDPTLLSAFETHPVMGVQVTEPSGTSNPPDSDSAYFGADLAHIAVGATSTSAIGAGISPPPMNNVANFSGLGGMDPSGNPITWETQQGGSAAHIIFISRYHPN